MTTILKETIAQYVELHGREGALFRIEASIAKQFEIRKAVVVLIEEYSLAVVDLMDVGLTYGESLGEALNRLDWAEKERERVKGIIKKLVHNRDLVREQDRED